MYQSTYYVEYTRGTRKEQSPAMMSKEMAKAAAEREITRRWYWESATVYELFKQAGLPEQRIPLAHFSKKGWLPAKVESNSIY